MSLEVTTQSQQQGKCWTDWKINGFSWNCKREEVTGQTTAPKTGKTDRQIQGTVPLLEHRLKGRSHVCDQCWARETEAVIDNLLKVRGRHIYKVKTPGVPTHGNPSKIVRFTPRGLTRFPQQGKGKWTILK